MLSADPIHPSVTRKSGHQYFFHDKHHGGGTSEDARWLDEVSQDDEFSIFDTSDWHNIADDQNWLYGLLRSAEGQLRLLGTWNQQVATFPFTQPGVAWHGYPLWPLNDEAPPNRQGQKFRPSKAVFEKMQSAGLVTARERKRLIKGDHA
jgi:hypothetical protein